MALLSGDARNGVPEKTDELLPLKRPRERNNAEAYVSFDYVAQAMDSRKRNSVIRTYGNLVNCNPNKHAKMSRLRTDSCVIAFRSPERARLALAQGN